VSPSVTDKLWRLCYIETLEELLRTLNVRTVLDVGANRGQYRDFLRNRIGFNELIMSFEPIKARAAHLKQRATDDGRWMVYDVALGAQDGIADLNVMKSDVFSSFHQPLHAQYSCEGNIIDHVEQVTVKRLDDVLLRQIDSSQGNIFLKLDTQGYDLEVIKGISDLDRIVLLQSEVSHVPIYETMPSMVEAISFFEDLGYAVAGMFPVTKDAMHRVIEFDCLLVRSAGKSPSYLQAS
jgi:FkbM family methyltransferase